MYVNPALCHLMSFFIGITQVCFMPAPVGDCSACCPHDDDIDIQYKLYTRSNPNKYNIIYPRNATALADTPFNPTKPTVIYLFGFSEAVTGPSSTTMRRAFLRRDYNFISVDWSRLIVFPWYLTAVKNTRYMGQRLAEFISFLNSNGIPAESLYVIGFSLGAEAAGFAGKYLKSSGLRIGRITGLDPAYPGYSFGGKNAHLAKGDALFVDIIHTNPGVFGFPTPIGDVDFYPNPGLWIQPGCWIDQLVKNNELSYFYGCSHNRAWRLYVESVMKPTAFPATLCRNFTNGDSSCLFKVDGYMGFGAQRGFQGKMYLITREKPPYSPNCP